MGIITILKGVICRLTIWMFLQVFPYFPSCMFSSNLITYACCLFPIVGDFIVRICVMEVVLWIWSHSFPSVEQMMFEAMVHLALEV